MYAVIKTGGKQYIVKEGERILVERLKGNPGEIVDLEEVLMVEKDGETMVGNPFVEGAVVKGEILGEKRGKKIIVFKMKRRKNYRRKKGHRQRYTELKINEIVLQ